MCCGILKLIDNILNGVVRLLTLLCLLIAGWYLFGKLSLATEIFHNFPSATTIYNTAENFTTIIVEYIPTMSTILSPVPDEYAIWTTPLYTGFRACVVDGTPQYNVDTCRGHSVHLDLRETITLSVGSTEICATFTSRFDRHGYILKTPRERDMIMLQFYLENTPLQKTTIIDPFKECLLHEGLPSESISIGPRDHHPLQTCMKEWNSPFTLQSIEYVKN